MSKQKVKYYNNRIGFTLVELMIVVVIIGILVAIAVPIYASSQEKARASACLANQKTINEASYKWHLEKGNAGTPYPVDVQMLVTDGYLESVPKCSGHDFSTVDSDGKTVCPDRGHHTIP